MSKNNILRKRAKEKQRQNAWRRRKSACGKRGIYIISQRASVQNKYQCKITQKKTETKTKGNDKPKVKI